MHFINNLLSFSYSSNVVTINCYELSPYFLPKHTEFFIMQPLVPTWEIAIHLSVHMYTIPLFYDPFALSIECMATNIPENACKEIKSFWLSQPIPLPMHGKLGIMVLNLFVCSNWGSYQEATFTCCVKELPVKFYPG